MSSTEEKQRILIKAVERAIAGGFKQSVGEQMIKLVEDGRIDFNSAEGMLTVRGLLTEQRFAKALWGTEPKICTQCERHHDTDADCDAGGWPFSGIDHWKWQMQQMVVAPNLINYLGTTL